MENDQDINQEQSLENKDVSEQSENNVDHEHNLEHEELEHQLQECQEQLSHWKDQFMRIAADFENFKKRLEKERAQTFRIIKGNILLDILPIVDNFERALTTKQETDDTKVVLQGFEMIYKELCKMLEKQGVKKIDSCESFNPELHEAVMRVPSDKHNSGEIVEILQKGYMIDKEVLRPAKVSVAE